MKRREFLDTSMAAMFVALFAETGVARGALAEQAVNQVSNRAGSDLTTLQLSRKMDTTSVKNAYTSKAKGIGVNTIPYVYYFYDAQSSKFVSPLDIKPTLPSGKQYTVEPKLQAFNLSRASQTQFKNLGNQLQLGVNATTQTSASDDLKWIFLNAVDVFLAKDSAGRDEQLTKFSSDNGGVPLKSSPKIQVSNGKLNLQVTAFGQRKDSVWRKLFDEMAKALKSPLASAALTGFGIPALATQAVAFVDHAVDVIQDEHKLVPLWQTGGLDFGVTQDTTERFKLQSGLWYVVDTDYAHQTNYLADHKVDLRNMDFRLRDKSNNVVDSNYLATDISIS